MIRIRPNALKLVAALFLVSPSACAQGLVVRQPDAAPTGAAQDPKADAELQQEIRALREQAAQLEALVEQLQQRTEPSKDDMGHGRRQDPDAERMRRMEQERFEREQQERKRVAAEQIAQVEKRAQQEMGRIKQDAQREIERIKAEFAPRPQEQRPATGERSPMLEPSRDADGQPMRDRAMEMRAAPGPWRSVPQPRHGNVQMFEVDEHGLPMRRVDVREPRDVGEGSRCACDCPSCGRNARARMTPRFDDPEIERLLDALRNRIAENRRDAQFRGRVVEPQPDPRNERRALQEQGDEHSPPQPPEEPMRHTSDEGPEPPRRDGGD